MGYEVIHYGHIWGSLIGKYLALHTLTPWIRAAINTIAKSALSCVSKLRRTGDTTNKCQF